MKSLKYYKNDCRSDKIFFKERQFCQPDLKAEILFIAEFSLRFQCIKNGLSLA